MRKSRSLGAALLGGAGLAAAARRRRRRRRDQPLDQPRPAVQPEPFEHRGPPGGHRPEPFEH